MKTRKLENFKSKRGQQLPQSLYWSEMGQWGLVVCKKVGTNYPRVEYTGHSEAFSQQFRCRILKEKQYFVAILNKRTDFVAVLK